MKKLLLLAAGLALVPASAQQAPRARQIWDRFAPLPYGFNVREVFPTRALPSALDGKPVSIAGFRGKKVIVNIFASW